jgi:hypothetical protein
MRADRRGTDALGSLIKMQQVDAGTVPQRVLASRTSFIWSKYTSDDKTRVAIQQLLDRVQSEPGVLVAAISNRYPFEPEIITGGPESVSHFKLRAALWNPANPHPSAPAAVSPTISARRWAFH